MEKIYSILLCSFLWVASYSAFSQAEQVNKRQDSHTLRIARTSDKIVIDGKLTEASWQKAERATDFWMSFPTDAEKVPEDLQTEVMVAYDDTYMYIGAICRSPHPYIVPTLKRDNREFWRGDVFGVLIDPVNQSTNGFAFSTNPAGVQYESLISGRTGTRAERNQRQSSGGFNTAWDNKWYVETSDGKGCWYVEMAIPFKSLRFEPNKRVWGINFTRGEPTSNAWHTWAPVPVQFLTMDLGYTGALIWDEAPKKVKSNFSIIPYTLGSYSQDFEEGSAPVFKARVGGDAKVAITSTLNLDVTVNPDFSQVDVDEQVTNLTTFNIRFPERRLFFLENSDLFADFGIPPMRPFFSRRIGLDEDGNTIPILFGARLSGNMTKDLRIGLMNMQTREDASFPGQNYTSFTMHQRVFQRSVVKGYLHNRQAMHQGEFNSEDYNRIAGLEFKYFSQDAKWQGFGGYGLSLSDGFKGDNYFYNFGGGYDSKNISFYTNFSGIGDNYYADMGWIPFADHYDAVRDTTIHVGFHHEYSRLSYSIYPPKGSKVNTYQFNISHVLDVDNDFDLLQNRISLSLITNLANSSAYALEYVHSGNQLLFPFTFTGEEPLPVGRYRSDHVKGVYQSDQRKDFGGTVSLQYGNFYGGKRLENSLQLKARVQPWGNFALTFVYNRLDFPEPFGDRNLFLIGPKIEVNFNRSLFWTTFLQYNTQADNFNINSRLQWRFQPLSDLFIVYTDNYAVEFWGKKNRALVLKLNYWLNL